MTEPLGWALVHFIWQGAFIAAGTFAVLRALPPSRASIRYATACTALLLMLAAPTVTVVRMAGTADASPVVEAGPAVSATPAASAAPLPERVARVLDAARARPARLYVERLLPAAVYFWLAGVLLLSARLLGGWYNVERLKRRSTRPLPEGLQARVAELAARLRITAPVRAVESSLVSVPALVGWMRPVILLPVSVVTGLPPGHLDAVIAHELAHVRRHDFIVNTLQVVVETVLFYHPAVWWCSRQVRIEREHCCDDLAVSACGDRLEYATALASLEELRRGGFGLALAATDGPLLERVRRVLGVPPAHRGSPAWLAGLTLAIVVIVAAGAAVTSAGPQPQDLGADFELRTTPHTVATQARQPLGEMRAPLAPPMPPEPPAPPPPPDGPSQDRNRMTWSDSTRRFTLETRGTLALADDDSDFVRMSDGGYFFLEEGGSRIPLLSTVLGATRAIELRGRADGSIERRYFVSGREQAWEPEGRQWLRELLPVLVRRTGLAADARVTRILERDGAAGVAGEIGRLESDYVRGLYLRLLTKQATLSAPELTQVLQVLQIESDFEMAQALIAIAETQTIPASAGPAYFQAARTIHSDFELRRGLTPLLRRPMDAAFVREMFAVSEDIDSDFELAEFLRAAASAGLVEQGRDAFFRSAGTIQSDFEHRRALTAVVARSDASLDTLEAVLRSAAGIGSDFEQAELILELARRHRVDGRLKERALDLADASIGSEHERGRVLSALLRSERSTR